MSDLERCPICKRPVIGQEPNGERPCQVQGGQRCYELGFERVSAQLARAAALLRQYDITLWVAAGELSALHAVDTEEVARG